MNTTKTIRTKAGRIYIVDIFHGSKYCNPRATVFEPGSIMNTHSSIATFGGNWAGQLGSRMLPKWIDAIPAKGKSLNKRIRLCDVFRERQSKIARAVLVRAGVLDSGDGWTYDGIFLEATKEGGAQ